MLDPKLLACFVETARAQSFSKAAENLGMTQSWVSRQVSSLEGQIGFKLFDRTTRTVVLTDRGRKLLARAEPAVEQIAGVRALAGRLARKQMALAIGVPAYALMVEARLEVFDRFVRDFPKVRMETRTDTVRHLRTSLREGELDASFSLATPDLGQDQELEVAMLCEGKLVLVVPQNHSWAGPSQVGLADIAGVNVAAFSRRSSPAMYDLIFSKVDAAGAKIIEFSDYGFYRRLEEASAVTLLPDWQPLPAPHLTRVEIADATIRADLVCMRLRAHRFPALDSFWAMLAQR